MPVSGGGLEQSHNAQAGVDIDTMLVITTHVTQACNHRREVAPTLAQLAALPQEHARAGQGPRRVESCDDGLEHQGHTRAARGMTVKVRHDHVKTESWNVSRGPPDSSSSDQPDQSAHCSREKRHVPIHQLRSGSSPTAS